MMARRKNTRFIDPRYFMDEKMERLDEASQEDIEREFDCKTKMREKYPKKEDQADPELGGKFMKKCTNPEEE
jgi:hypothetical protein